MKKAADPILTDDSATFASGDDVDAYRAQHRQVSPEVDTETMAVFGRIYRITTRMAPHIEALFAEHGLERGEYDVLATLLRGGPPYRKTPTDVYTSLMVSSGGLTHRLKWLEAAALVRRVPCPQDGRRLMVELTEEGYRRTKRAFEADMRLEGQWLSELSEEDRGQLADLLRLLNASVPQFEKNSASETQEAVSEG
ncbi:MAG: MarR family transcriptional regulator [Breoghania sp.]|nr:MarR family transcriptional regulator [Breoghania sp.]